MMEREDGRGEGKCSDEQRGEIHSQKGQKTSNVREHFRLNSKVNIETWVHCHMASECHNSMVSPLKTPRMERRIKEKLTQCKSMGLVLMWLSNITSALRSARFLLIDYSQI